MVKIYKTLKIEPDVYNEFMKAISMMHVQSGYKATTSEFLRALLKQMDEIELVIKKVKS